MNIIYLQKALSSITEIKPLGKTAEIDGVLCHIIGFVRYGNVLRLAVLQYDEGFAEQTEAIEIAQLNGYYKEPQTNRERLHSRRKNNCPANIFHTVKTIRIGEILFNIEGCDDTRCDWQNWQIPVLLAEFLKQGWNPAGIDYQSMTNLSLTFVSLSGDYDSILDFGENSPVRLTFHPDPVTHLVEQPVLLSVGANYPDRLYFQTKNTGEEHWVQINRVYLLDIWAETMQTFDDPRLIETFTAFELAECKADFEHHLTAICPPGMYIPVIEYECAENLSLEFHSQAWLETVGENQNTGMTFLMKPEGKTGISGLPLQVAIIQEPMAEDCRIIDCELFSFTLLRQHDDVIL